MKLGALDISTVKLGANQVQAVYQGDNLVWQNAPVATAATGVGQTSFTANWNAYTGAVVYLLDVSESSDFSTFVYEDQQVNAPTTSYVVIGLDPNTTYYYRVRASTEALTDADAQAFFDRVTTAGGSLSTTEQDAVNTLVVQMKSDGIWSKMKAIYPMVGASAAACAQNLKSSSFTGTFTATGWTFASTGVTPTSAYMDTGLNPATVINDVNDGHLSYYSRTESTGTYIDIGCFDGTTAFDLVIKYSTVAGACINMSDGNTFAYTGTTKGHFIASQNNTNDVRKYYRDNAFSNTQNVAQNSQPSRNIVLGARDASLGTIFTNRECAFASIGNGLTDGEAGLFYTAVQTFQTTLSRQV